MKQVWKTIAALLLAGAVLLWFFTALGNLERKSGEEARRLLEDALRRGAAACYAAEGIYPPSVAYLTEHYGIRVDDSRFAVHYEIFADNLMPSITVLELP